MQQIYERTGVIYSFRNVHNDKRYIGQTLYPEERYKSHISNLGNYEGRKLFYRAMNKYSNITDWDYTILESNIKESELNNREIYWIDYYDSYKNGYNMTMGGDGSKGSFGELNGFYGKHHSIETREAISKGNKGKTLSQETKNKISISNKGRKCTDDTKEKISKANKGHSHTKETKEKISKANKGKQCSEYSKNIAREMCSKRKGELNPNFGKHLSNETKNKLSERNKGKIPWNKGKKGLVKRVYNDPNDKSKGWKNIKIE